ncbi:MAG TPA: tRNA (adenosine(37)-N6)-dimethylallyltransferase MiaA [Candidatus Limadaptatus stercorigallinarum]|uniref:tRNA dimethylallyltransferase n=1 Tax=Candidatus Limadaptatus stercorigallinarum TaxID=2840845 RepID=A0A9D1HSJ2_9FIRM|nr:tRNA (adenosine(37)-N6)-dimethylallyltransferase MiaA [Candidatus Limadaptatus stercorigallinarum]
MNEFSAPHAVFVMGPTASGKSEFAFRLAKEENGVVISADSMQIYRGLDVGTAKESPARRAEVPHAMIDVADYDEEFSVARYRDEAVQAGLAALRNGKLPVFAGGTGLYFEALFYPMSFGRTDKNPALRAELEKEYAENGGAYMLGRLKEVDPDTADRLHPNDAKRVVRALEIALSGGTPMSQTADSREDPDVIAVGFRPSDRAELYARINARTEQMFAQGLAEEIARIAPDFSLQSMQAIGYREFAPFADRFSDGKPNMTAAELSAVCDRIKQDTRNYAKRQLTWFRRYKFVEWFEIGDFDGAMRYVRERLRGA